MDRVVEVLTKSPKAIPILPLPKKKFLAPTATKPTKVEQLRALTNQRKNKEEELAQATKPQANIFHQEIRANVSLIPLKMIILMH
jgi:hypothetical protein